MRRFLKEQGYIPDEVVTDELGSYGAVLRIPWIRRIRELVMFSIICSTLSAGAFMYNNMKGIKKMG